MNYQSREGREKRITEYYKNRQAQKENPSTVKALLSPECDRKSQTLA